MTYDIYVIIGAPCMSRWTLLS